MSRESESSWPETTACERCGFLLPRGVTDRCAFCLLDFGLHGYHQSMNASDAVLTTTPFEPSKEMGDYQLIEEIACGGMGVVFRARQMSLNRIVAVKLILSGLWASLSSIQRFKAEAEAVARLDHPHIVPIYEIGVHHGQHFYSMKLIEGRNLAQVLAVWEKQGDAADRERASARIVATLARAVHYAHQRRVLHRDLKPTNILIDALGEPHLTDFGLAKIIEHESNLTHTAAILGTPNYMAPEQASGKTKLITTAADIYSLGAILYELLTGRPPFVGESSLETLNLVQDTEPVPPRALRPDIGRDLETICLTCLRKEPEFRYGSAEALADELDRFLRDEPIRARASGVLEKLWRWGRRKPGLAGLSIALLLAIVGGLTTTSWQWHRASFAYALQQHMNQQLEEKNILLRLQRVHDQLEKDDIVGGLPVLAHILRNDPSNRLAAEMFVGYLASQRLVPMPEPRQMHTNENQGLIFSPDGTSLASWSRGDGNFASFSIVDGVVGMENFRMTPGADVVAIGFSSSGHSLFAGLNNGVVHWLDSISGRPLGPPIHLGEPLRTASFLEGGHRLLTVSKEGALKVWETNGVYEILSEVSPLTTAASLSPDGRRLAAMRRDGLLCAWETATGRLTLSEPSPANARQFVWDLSGLYFGVASDAPGLHVFASSDSDKLTGRPEVWKSAPPVDALTFSSDGALVATAHADRTLRFWHLGDGTPAEGFIRVEARQRRIAFAKGDRWLLGVDENGACNAWDSRSGMLVAARLSREWRMQGWAVHAGQQLMASANYGGYIFLFELEPREPRHTILRHGSPLNTAEFSPNGDFVATAGADGTVWVWNSNSGEKVFGPLTHPGSVAKCSFSPDGTQLLTACEDGSARVWDYRLGREITPPLRHEQALDTATFSPGGHIIVTASRDFTARLWNLDGEPVSPPLHHGRLITRAQFSPDGRLLATAGHALTTQLWSVPNGQLVREIPTSAAVSALCFSHDGMRLAIGHFNGTLRVWDVATGTLVSPVLASRGGICTVTFSSDDRTIVWSALDNQAALWRFGETNAVPRFFSHASAALATQLTPDGLRLFTACDDGVVQIWDAGSGFKLAELARHDGAAFSMQLHPDGRRVMTASTDGTAFVHELPLPPLPVPEWLPELADSLTGVRLDASGTPRNWPEWAQTMSQFLTSPPQDSFGQQVWSMVAPRSLLRARGLH